MEPEYGKQNVPNHLKMTARLIIHTSYFALSPLSSSLEQKTILSVCTAATSCPVIG